MLVIFHLNLKKQMLTISKQHIFLDLENKISTNEHNFERNLHNAYKYNNLPLKQKSNFLYGGILQITPNCAYYLMRYSTSTLSES